MTAVGIDVTRACDLACLVRDRDDTAPFLAALSPAGKDRLLLTLAAMVPVDDASPGELLAWTGGQVDAVWHQDPLPYIECHCAALEPCGTPAAWARHKRRGEPVDAACGDAYLAYQRAYQAARRRRLRGAA